MKSNKKGLIFIALIFLVIAYFMSGNKEIKPLEEVGNNEETKIEEMVKNTELEEKIDTKKIDEEIDEEQKQEKELKESKKEELENKKVEEKKEIIKSDAKNTKEKDKYQTDPTPEGKPKPKEWQDVKKDLEITNTATLSITCKSILNNIDLFNTDKLSVLPEDGVIYSTREVEFHPGESVFDILLREMKNNKIHMEFSMTPVYNSSYIEGINNIYEFDCGELSGWMYKVNDWYPNYGVSRYVVEQGDVIEFVYTCDLGRDIGGGFALGGE